MSATRRMNLPGFWLAARTSFSWKIISCLILATTADYLFFGHVIGWTMGLFTLLFLGFYGLHNNDALRRVSGKLVSILMFGLAVALVNNPNPVAVPLTLLGFIALGLQRDGWPRSAVSWFLHSVAYPGIQWIRPLRDLNVLSKYLRKHPGKCALNRYWLVPATFSIAFILLFAQANPIIGDWIRRIDWKTVGEILKPERVWFFILVLIASWSLIRANILKFNHLSRGRKRSSDFESGLFTPSPSERALLELLPPKPPSFLNPKAVRNSLVVFNLIFLVQTVLDTLYLWGGQTLPDGLTYAEYAHQGAYPLIATALLAGAFVLTVLKPGGQTERFPGIKALVVLWIIQNVFLTVSSVYRTLLYIEVYSLTHLRVAALIWMGLLAAGLVWMMLRIIARRSNAWLINVNAVTLLVILYCCGFVDFNAVIARYNVEHCAEVTGKGQPLDVAYFGMDLGVSAIPALDWYAKNANPTSGNIEYAKQIRGHLSTELKNDMKDWRGWTWRNGQLMAYLKANTPQLANTSGWTPEEEQTR